MKFVYSYGCGHSKNYGHCIFLKVAIYTQINTIEKNFAVFIKTHFEFELAMLILSVINQWSTGLTWTKIFERTLKGGSNVDRGHNFDSVGRGRGINMPDCMGQCH